MKTLTWSAFGLCLLLLPPAAATARMLDLSKPADVIAAEIRMGCSPDPAKPRLSTMTGRLYSQRAGEANRHLFDVQAVNTRACTVLNDPKRGPGYRSVTREIMVYLDPATGQILDSWTNPWTGETVSVVPMFNDPVNMREPKFAYGPDGKPTAVWDGTITGGQAVSRRIMPFFRDSPLGGAYQDFVGGKYAVMELSVTVAPAAAWLDTAKPTPVPVTSVWTRLSPWLPWMKMGGREGTTVLHAVWQSGTVESIPEPLRSFIREKHPEYATAPPLDDTRASVTSWDGIKRALDASKPAPPPERPRP